MNAAFASQLRAEVYAYCGREAEAFAHLLEADASGLMDLLWLDGCPVLAGLRADPRFAAVRGRVKARADEIIAVLAASPSPRPPIRPC
jgi:serine/threonine-protein kinase